MMELENSGRERIHMSSKTQGSSMLLFLFHQETDCRACECMGMHEMEQDGSPCMVYRVWASNVLSVPVAGELNDWDADEYPMEKISRGVREGCLSPVSPEYMSHKFYTEQADDTKVFKSDPHASHFGDGFGNASRYYSLDGFS